MPLPTRKSTLGKSIIKSRFGAHRPHENDTTLIRPEHAEAAPNLASITQENDLESFLRTAEMAETEFTAERRTFEIINTRSPNAFQLSAEKEREMLAKISQKSDRLVIPRRPKWDNQTTALDLKRLENESFLKWRASLAFLEEEEGMVMTPFERNLEVWRQLWRVIERSDLLVQIVDCRNPLFFRCRDLERYVKQVSQDKDNFLLLNKADFLTEMQRQEWAEYFQKEKIRFAFFSAMKEDDDDELVEETVLETSIESVHIDNNENEGSNVNEITRILSSKELLSILPAGKTIGLVGYPNVGKSSTINKLIKQKKVTVSATPGKTKHFQTIHINDLILCDCPGLVFPNFAVSKAEMIVNGVLPIDQMRDAASPAQIVANRIPRYYLEWIYGITLPMPFEGEDPNRPPTGPELLREYARMRGYMRAGQGTPDESRAARYILKDYVNGKLLYCHPPPNMNALQFNEQYLECGEKYKEAHEKPKRAHSSEEELPTIQELPIENEKEVSVHVKMVRKGAASSITRPNYPYMSDAASMISSDPTLAERSSKKMHKKTPRKKDHSWRVK